MPQKTKITDKIRKKSGIWLDISFGGKPQPRAVVLGPHGDIRQNPTQIPFRLSSKTVNTAVITHVLEFIPPERWYAWWDELHRVMQPYGMAYFSGPYGGDLSQGWLSEPAHRVRVVESSFSWLDPRMPFYAVNLDRGRPLPKPWYTMAVKRVPGIPGTRTTSYNCVMQARPVERKKTKRVQA